MKTYKGYKISKMSDVNPNWADESNRFYRWTIGDYYNNPNEWLKFTSLKEAKAWINENIAKENN